MPRRDGTGKRGLNALTGALRMKRERSETNDCAGCIPSAAVKSGTELLDIEMWCWGRDIAGRGGNALLEYGFTRERPPDGVQGSSRYALGLENGSRIVLWGWGVLYSDSSQYGIFLRRQKFSPRIITDGEEKAAWWAPGDIRGLRAPAGPRECAVLRKQLADLLTWISGYENWIQKTLGTDYRTKCIEARAKPTRIKAEEIPRLWERMAKGLSVKYCNYKGV